MITDRFSVGVLIAFGICLSADWANAESKISLVEAARQGKHDAVREILRTNPACINEQSPEIYKGIESNYGRWTALHWAVDRDDCNLVDILLKHRADPNLQSQHGLRPLERVKSRAVAEKLIEAGAEVNLAGDSGCTPLHCANTAPIAELLIEKGARIGIKDSFSSTPLHAAAKHGHTAVAQVLIERGAAIDCRNAVGETPLFYTCGSGNIILARLLIQEGADVNAKNKHGERQFGGALRERRSAGRG